LGHLFPELFPLSFKKEDHDELVKIVEDHCNPFPLFLPRNLGVEIPVRRVEL
jgi:hypothetical protein